MLPLRLPDAFRPLRALARCHSLAAPRRIPRTRSRLPTFPPSHFNRGYQHFNFSTLPTEADSSRETSFPDSERPDLYYHLVSPPTPISATQSAFALSFLPARPKTADSSVIIGWLPATQESGQSQEGAGLNDFKENARFRQVLHRAVQDGLREGVDEIQTNRAIQLQNGWMHIHDDRNLPALGRVGDPDDILASVLVEDGKILPETYQAMPAYRLCTSDGVTKLTPGLALKLQSLLSVQNIIPQN